MLQQEKQKSIDAANYIVGVNLSKYAALSIVSYILLALPMIIDSLIVTYYFGASAIVVINLFFPLLFFAEAIHTGIGTAAVNCFSRQKGANESGAEKIFSDTLFVTLSLSLITALILTLWGDNFFYLLGATSLNISEVSNYGQWMIWVIPPMVISNVLFYFVHADNNPKLASYSLWIYNIVNIMLDLFLIGVCKMSIEGAAIAYFVAEIVKILILLYHFKSPKCSIKINFTVPSAANIKEVAAQMSVTVLKSIFTAVGLLFVNRNLAATYPLTTLSIYYILYTCRNFFSNIYTGAKVYLAPLVSAYYGDKEYAIIRILLRKTLIISIALGGGVMLFLYFEQKWIYTLFNLDYQSYLSQCRLGMLLFVAMIPLHTINTLMITQYQASRKYKIAFLIILVHDLIGITVIAYLVTHFFNAGAIWWIWLTNEIVTLLIWLTYAAIIRYKHKLSSILLFPKESETKSILHYLLPYDGSNLSESLEDIEQRLQKFGLSPQILLRGQMASETLFLIFQQRMPNAKNKQHYAYLKIIIHENKTIECQIKFADNRTNINQLLSSLIFKQINEDELELSILKNMSKEFHYDRLIGICRITVIIE